MSFILEALKKADAERDRGAVPDLHAQGMLPEAAFEAGPAGRGKPWLWLLAGIGLAAIAGVAWQWLGPQPPAPETVATPPPQIAPPAAPPVAVAPPPQAPTQAPPVAVDASRPAQDAAEKPAPRTARAAAAKHAAAQDAGAPAAPAVARKESEKPRDAARTAVAATDDGAAAPAPKASRKAPAASPASGVERVPLFAELPDDVRRQVPALKLGGLVYSAAPASRMVLVNGDLQREGGTVAPGLTLERINPKSVIFSLRGQRFEVPL